MEGEGVVHKQVGGGRGGSCVPGGMGCEVWREKWWTGKREKGWGGLGSEMT